MTDQEDLHYPHLDGCKATLTSTSGGSRPPVQLPIECRSAVHVPIPSIYDFQLVRLRHRASQWDWRLVAIVVSNLTLSFLNYREIGHEEKGRT